MRHAVEHASVVRAKEPGDAAGLLAPLAVRSWRGASGRWFTHTVYSLIGCPALQSGTFILVRRGADGVRNVLSVGHTETPAASLNLARIRREGARLSANEVHVYADAATEQGRAAIAFDISAAHGPVGAAAQASH